MTRRPPMSHTEFDRYLDREAEKADGGPVLKLCYACRKPITETMFVDTNWEPPRWYHLPCQPEE